MKKGIIITLTVIWVIIALVVWLMWTIAIGVNTGMTNETSSEVDRTTEVKEQSSVEDELSALLDDEWTGSSVESSTWSEMVSDTGIVLDSDISTWTTQTGEVLSDTGANETELVEEVTDTSSGSDSVDLENELNNLTQE